VSQPEIPDGPKIGSAAGRPTIEELNVRDSARAFR
jgi:hypothetical protein